MSLIYSDISEAAALRARLEALSAAKNALQFTTRQPLALVMGPRPGSELPSDTPDLTIQPGADAPDWPAPIDFPDGLRLALNNGLLSWIAAEMTIIHARLVELGADVTGAPGVAPLPPGAPVPTLSLSAILSLLQSYEDAAAALSATVDQLSSVVAGLGSPDGLSIVTFTQVMPSTVWTITHNLGRRPVDLRIYDTTNEECLGDVTHPNANTTVVTFSAAFGGQASYT